MALPEPALIDDSRADKVSALRWIARDVLINSLTPIGGITYRLAAEAQFFLGRSTVGFDWLAKASRYRQSAYADAVRSRLTSFEKIASQLVSNDCGRAAAINRSIVLRDPGPKWKGILLITFTAVFSHYYRSIDFRRLARDYHVFLEPSWMGYCDPDILFWTLADEPVFVQSSDANDRAFIRKLDSNLVPVEFGASDWVDDRLFYPIPSAKKTYDAIYVANRGAYKRPHVFFRAIARAARVRPQVRAAYVCASWGGGRDSIRNLIRFYGVSKNVDLLESLRPEQVNEAYNSARMCVLLSRKEGSNRSLFESMFAGTPVLLIRENAGVNKSYINPSTGVVCPEVDLHEFILSASELQSHTNPRAWALANISARSTRRKMVDAIRRVRPHEEISEDSIALKCNRPEVEYYDSPNQATQLDRVSQVLSNYENHMG